MVNSQTSSSLTSQQHWDSGSLPPFSKTVSPRLQNSSITISMETFSVSTENSPYPKPLNTKVLESSVLWTSSFVIYTHCLAYFIQPHSLNTSYTLVLPRCVFPPRSLLNASLKSPLLGCQKLSLWSSSKNAPSTAFLISNKQALVFPAAHMENPGVTLDSSLSPPTSNTSLILVRLALKSMKYIKAYLKHAHLSLLHCYHHHTPKMNESLSPGLPVPSLHKCQSDLGSQVLAACQNPSMTVHPSEVKAKASAVTHKAAGMRVRATSSPTTLPLFHSSHRVLFPREHGRAHSHQSLATRPVLSLVHSFFPYNRTLPPQFLQGLARKSPSEWDLPNNSA